MLRLATLHKQLTKPVNKCNLEWKNVTQESKSAGNQTGEEGQSMLNQAGEALQQINPFK